MYRGAHGKDRPTSHDREAQPPAAAAGQPARERPEARILIVGGDPNCRAELVRRLRGREHRCTHVSRLDEAQLALGSDRFDLLLLNRHLPDGDGLHLARLVQEMCPLTKTIVFAERGTFRAALEAMRCGAIDYIATIADLEELVERVDSALTKSDAERRRDRRIRRLQRICRELTEARREISDQVDTLCQDLVGAYKDLNDQIHDASMTSEFRTLCRQELDVEELLRTMLEYLLSKTGPTNAAVFLPDSDDRYSLGAYVNYDCPRESIEELLDRLAADVCPQLAGEPELVAFDDADAFAAWLGDAVTWRPGQLMVAFACRHEEECLAVLVLFRDSAAPFEPRIAGTLDLLRTIFAEQLARIIRIHHRAESSWPDEPAAEDDDDFGWGTGLAA